MMHNISYKQEEEIIIHVLPILKDLVPGFLENRYKDVQSILKALAQDEYETIKMTGHKMKGSGGGYGFHTITDIGQSLEQAAQARDAKAIQQGVDELANYLERVEIVYE